MSSVAASLLERLQYNTKPVGIDIGLQNLQKLHPQLTETNPLSIAALISNPAIPDTDKAQFWDVMKILVEREQKMYADYIKRYDELRGNENSVPDEPVSVNQEEQ